MPKLSAGLLVFRTGKTIEVFIVHPGGPFWAKKDTAAWSLPKGEYTENEDPLQAAKREFREETGQDAPEGEYIDLGEVKYGNKKLHAWAVEGNVNAEAVHSNSFEMEWPPKSGRTEVFPEVDRAGWFAPGVAKKKLVGGQVPFIDVLLEHIGATGTNATVDDQLSLF